MWKTTLAYYGPVHIAAIGTMLVFLAAGIVLGIKAKGNSKSRDKAMTILGFVFIILEAFKIIFRIRVNEGVDLTLISFQICSIPMYLLPFIYFMKDGKLKQSFVGYISFHSFTSAFFYFVKPAAAINTAYIAISVQSILWHSLMVCSGVYAMIAYGLLTKEGFRTFIYSYILWVITAAIAVILNIILIKSVPGTAVNLFYIAPNSTFKYPILSILFKEPKPYPLFLIAYLIYYFIGGLMVYGISFGIKTLATKKKA
ncbi:MAG: YwaF family protein [Spirochaetales bacterium]|nr:YwaF family protein [Spirochaetales bacterium]